MQTRKTLNTLATILHLPTPEGWKAELALGGWLNTVINVRHRELNLDTVAHLSINRAHVV